MGKHTERIGSLNPYLTGMGCAMYRAFLNALPEYRNRITGLTLSHALLTDRGDEICESVFFNKKTGAVFVLVPRETEETEEKAELATGQIGPQGVIR